MTETSLVSVYPIDPDGGTGNLIGFARLVDRSTAVLMPATAAVLTDPDRAKLRVAIPSATDSGVVAEIIDVLRIEVTDVAGFDPLTALVLKRSATSPVGATVANWPAARSEVEGAERVHSLLTDAPPPQLIDAFRSPLPGLPPPPPVAPWCYLFGMGCPPGYQR